MHIDLLTPSPFEASIGYAAAWSSHALGSALLPEEVAVAPRGRSLRRRLAFDVGRAAAHAALRACGRAVCPVLRASTGAPLWPLGIVGSISHTEIGGVVFGVAAIASADMFAGVGLDLERIRPLSVRALERLFSPHEVAWARSERAAYALRSTALFAAREALFKAVSPGYPGRMEYTETVLVWDGGRGGFFAETKLPASPHRSRLESFVRLDTRGGCVLASVALPVITG